MNGDQFRATCKSYMELRHIRTREQLRSHTTVGSSTTFRKYWNDPALMPMGVFLQIMDCLNVPEGERFKILK